MSRTLPTSSKTTVIARVGSAEVTLELELQLEQPSSPSIGLPVYRWTATIGDTERTGISEVDRRPGMAHARVSAIENRIIDQLLG